MNILVNEQVRLTEVRPSDKPALVEQLNDKEIYDRTLRIPYPYTDTSAEEWLAVVAKTTEQQGRPVHWAIRNAEDHLIGACGFNDFQMGKSHRAEIGYVLAKPFWGQGIMTAVVRRACQYAFEEFGLVKIIAHVNRHEPSLRSGAGKVRLRAGGLPEKALSQGRAISRRKAIRPVAISGRAAQQVPSHVKPAGRMTHVTGRERPA